LIETGDFWQLSFASQKHQGEHGGKQAIGQPFRERPNTRRVLSSSVGLSYREITSATAGLG
jgi:hypothetical protein